MRAGPPNPPWLAADVRWAADFAPAAGAAHSARVSQLAVATQPAPPTRVAAGPVVPAAPAGGHLAVALHDVEPATLRRCIEIREWLHELRASTA